MDSNLLSESLMNVAISTDIATQDELTNVSSDLKGIVDKVSAEAHSANSNLSAYLPLSGNKKLVGDITAFNADIYKESQEHKAAISVGANEARNDYQFKQITSYISQVNINLDMPLNVLLTSEMSVLYINNTNETWSKVEYYDSISGTIVAKSAEYNRSQYYWEVYNHYWDGSSGYITLTALNDGSSDPDRGSLFGYGRRLEISYQYGSFYVDYSIAVNGDELTGSSYSSAHLQGSYGENDQYFTLTSDYTYITPSYLTQSGHAWFEDLWTCDFTVISGTSNELPYALNECSNRRIFFTDYVDSDTYGWLGDLGDYFSKDYTSINSYELSHFSIDEGHVFTKRSSSSGSTYDYVSEEFDSPLKNIAFSLYNTGTDYAVSELKVGLNEEHGYALYTFNNEIPTQLTTLFVHSMEKYATKDDVENSLELVSSKISDVSASLDSTNATVTTNANKAKDTFYGSSSSSTNALTASVNGWSNTTNSLKVGGTYYVTFSNDSINSIVPKTLNINSSGAKEIVKQNGTNLYSNPERGVLVNGGTYAFLYDGSRYILLNPFERETFYGSAVGIDSDIIKIQIEKDKNFNIRPGNICVLSFKNYIPTTTPFRIQINKDVLYAYETTYSGTTPLFVNHKDIKPNELYQVVCDDVFRLRMSQLIFKDRYNECLPLSGGTISGNFGVYDPNLSSDSFSINDATNKHFVSIGSGASVKEVSLRQNGVALGISAIVSGNYGTAIGNSAYASSSGVAVGSYHTEATTTRAIAIGCQTSATAKDAIQLGRGINNETSSFQVLSYKVLDGNGNVPYERLSSVLINEEYISKATIINALSDITTENLSGIDYNNPTQDSLSVLYHNVGILQNALSNVLTVVS